MRILIEKEALGKKPKDAKESKYADYASKLGFSWEKNAPIGFLNLNHKANLIMNLVKEYARILVNDIGIPIYEVSGSNFFDMSYPVVDAYASLFGDRLFQPKSEDKSYVMSYDASYPQFNLASSYKLYEKDLPLAHFSISDCYRNEQSGECMLLFRGRRFNMPDIHPYCKDVDQAFELYEKIENQLLNSFKNARREYYNVVKISSIENWNKYQPQLISIARRNGKDMLIEIRRDNVDRYWIVDIDYSIIDKLSGVREIGCIQIDIGNASRLGIEYIDQDGERQNPVIIHSAVPGGLERYLYMLFDQFDEFFPIWLHPIQIRLVPVSEKFLEFSEKLMNDLKKKNIRVDIDDRAEPVGKRIKRAKSELIPNVLLIGENELDGNGNISKLNDLVKSIKQESSGKPFIQYSWPSFVSKQVV